MSDVQKEKTSQMEFPLMGKVYEFLATIVLTLLLLVVIGTFPLWVWDSYSLMSEMVLAGTVGASLLFLFFGVRLLVKKIREIKRTESNIQTRILSLKQSRETAEERAFQSNESTEKGIDLYVKERNENEDKIAELVRRLEDSADFATIEAVCAIGRYAKTACLAQAAQYTDFNDHQAFNQWMKTLRHDQLRWALELLERYELNLDSEALTLVVKAFIASLRPEVFKDVIEEKLSEGGLLNRSYGQFLVEEAFREDDSTEVSHEAAAP